MGYKRLRVVIRQVIVIVSAHATIMCCFIYKLISHLIAVYACMQFLFEQDRLTAGSCLLHELLSGTTARAIVAETIEYRSRSPWTAEALFTSVRSLFDLDSVLTRCHMQNDALVNEAASLLP